MRSFLKLFIIASLAIPTVSKAETIEFQGFKTRHLLIGLSEFSLYSLYLGSPNIRGSSYIPNFSPKLGLQYGYRNIMLKFSVPLSQPSDEIYRRGRSREINYMINQYWRGFGIEFYYQSYRGLYAHNPLSDFSANRPDRFPQLPDAFVMNTGINTYWVLHPERYSLRAAFSKNEFQTASGGSLLFTAYFNHLRLSTGDAFIPGTDPNAPNTPPDISTGKFNTLGVGTGFGYSYVRGRFFIVGQLLGGIGAQQQRTKETAQEAAEAFAPALMLNSSLNVGMKTETTIWGVRGIAHSVNSRIRNVQVASSLVSGQLFYGVRF